MYCGRHDCVLLRDLTRRTACTAAGGAVELQFSGLADPPVVRAGAPGAALLPFFSGRRARGDLLGPLLQDETLPVLLMWYPRPVWETQGNTGRRTCVMSARHLQL